MTTLHLAVLLGDLPALHKLLDPTSPHAASSLHQLNLSEKTYGTPLAIAARYGALDKMEVLLDRGADVNDEASSSSSFSQQRKTRSISKWGTPLEAAVTMDQPDAVGLLLERGADWRVRKAGGGGETVFHEAAERGGVEVLRRLLEGVGAAVVREGRGGEEREGHPAAWPDADGQTPLHVAARKGNMEFVKVLVDALLPSGGVQAVDVEDRLGATPLVEAAANEHVEVEKYLEGVGAKPRPEEDGLSVRMFGLVFANGERQSFVMNAAKPGSLVLRTQATFMAEARQIIGGVEFESPVVQIEIGADLGRITS